MSVVSLHGGEIMNDRRTGFLTTIAGSFDRYVEEHGFEPDAVVFTLCGIAQPSQCGWDIRGGSVEGPNSILALASVHISAQAAMAFQVIE